MQEPTIDLQQIPEANSRPGPAHAASSPSNRSTDDDSNPSGPSQAGAHDSYQPSGRCEPPRAVPGYTLVEKLGAGSFGEVWKAVDDTTRREVAIKFYFFCDHLEWSGLASEVEKLAFLSSDRYVVQLFDVGWNERPPYFVMEYIESGSLEQYLSSENRGSGSTIDGKSGSSARTLPIDEAVTLIREIAIGLLHAHGKGILHCDLKPANVLLDQDHRPRLADFGQSRLANDQRPSLGTLFYMAPEQANCEAQADARWDVYALGAILYRMLVGIEPRRDLALIQEINQVATLPGRLDRYRRGLMHSPTLAGHKTVPGIDRALVAILERCLAVDPRRRYPNIQAVIDDLDRRALARARWPLLIAGGVAPVLLVLAMAGIGATMIAKALSNSSQTIETAASYSLRLTARLFAERAGFQITRRWQGLERLASEPRFLGLFRALTGLEAGRARPLDGRFLSRTPLMTPPGVKREEFPTGFPFSKGRELLKSRGLPGPTGVNAAPASNLLTRSLEEVLAINRKRLEESGLTCASLAVFDRQGLMIARDPPTPEFYGKNWAYRDYFHGQGQDLPEGATAPPITQPHRSSVYLGKTDSLRKVAFSVPVVFRSPIAAAEAEPSPTTPSEKVPSSSGSPTEDEVVGVVMMTVTAGDFADLQLGIQTSSRVVPVLVDARADEVGRTGAVLLHPEFEARRARQEPPLPPAYHDTLPNDWCEHLSDPVFEQVTGHNDSDWFAATSPVRAQTVADVFVDTEWLVVVQERRADVLAPVRDLRDQLLRQGLLALLANMVIIAALWWFARGLSGNDRTRLTTFIRRQARLATDSLPLGSGSEGATSSRQGWRIARLASWLRRPSAQVKSEENESPSEPAWDFLAVARSTVSTPSQTMPIPSQQFGASVAMPEGSSSLEFAEDVSSRTLTLRNRIREQQRAQRPRLKPATEPIASLDDAERSEQPTMTWTKESASAPATDPAGSSARAASAEGANPTVFDDQATLSPE